MHEYSCIFVATALLIVLLQDSTHADCNVPRTRQLSTVQAAVNQLQATPLNTGVMLKTAMMCQSQCLAMDMCAYITFGQSTHTCTLYAIGTTTINVAGLFVYELAAKNIEVDYAAATRTF